MKDKNSRSLGPNKPETNAALAAAFNKLNGYSGDPVEFIETIYQAADTYYKNEVAPKAACKRGCSHCCHVPVALTAIEADYITHYTGRIINIGAKELIREPDGTPYPFLVNNECSIYEYRPLNCRVFASMDSADFCAQGGHVPHAIHTIDCNGGLVFFMDILAHASMRYPFARYSDIREYFTFKESGV